MEGNFNRHLGSKLRMRRLALGLTQTKVAQAINGTFQQIQKYEKGTNGISSLRIMQLSNFLKVPVLYFFEDFRLYEGGTVSKDKDSVEDLKIGSAAGSISSLVTGNATAGIGFLFDLGANRLKIELDSLEKEGLSTLLSNPKIFTLNNQTAKIIQGEQIPYQVAAEGGQTANTEFVDAALSLEVTPSIVGDGNIVLQLKVNNDSRGTQVGTVPAINTMEIDTKLLVEDGSIVVIGGVFKDTDVNTIQKAIGLSKIPILGGAFRAKSRDLDKSQLLVFIAPRVV